MSYFSDEENVLFSDSDNASQSSFERRKSKSRKRLSEGSRSRLSTPGAVSEVLGAGYTQTPATGRIFRNLLIVEDNLRQQVAQQKTMRRKYLTFLAVLCSLITSISHHLVYADSTGTTRVILQFVLLALIVTLMLYHLSGEYQKTIVLPRKFLSSTNKGLRQLNVRLVKIKTSFSDSVVDTMREIGLVVAAICLTSLHKVYPSTYNNRDSKLECFLRHCQAYCQPRIGITDVKLVLNSRAFNTDVREGWELYRSEFWIQEGQRRRASVVGFMRRRRRRRKTKTTTTRAERELSTHERSECVENKDE